MPFGCSTLKGCVIFMSMISRRKYPQIKGAFCGIFAPIFRKSKTKRTEWPGTEYRKGYGAYENYPFYF